MSIPTDPETQPNNASSAETKESFQDMLSQYDAWARRCGVIPRERIDELMAQQNVGTAFWERADFKAPYLP